MNPALSIGKSFRAVFGSSQSLGARLAKNTVWSAAGSVASQGASLLSALIVARLLGVHEFGKLALIQTTVLLMVTLGELGLSLTTTKFVSRWRSADPDRAGHLIGWSLRTSATSACVVALIMVAIETWVAPSVQGDFSREWKAACGWLLFEILNRVQISALAGMECFDQVARVQLCRALTLVPFTAVGAWHGGLAGAVVGLALASMAVFLAGQWILLQQCRKRGIRLSFRGFPGRSIVATSSSLWISSLLMTGSAWAVCVLLAKHPGGLAELGIYNAVDKWKTALLFLPNMLFQVNLPMLSHSRGEGDHRACVRIVKLGLLSTVVVTAAAALGVVLLAPWLMASYGKDFSAGSRVLVLAAAAAVVSAVYTVGSGVLWAIGRPAQMLGIDALKTAVLVGVCWAGLASSAWNLTLAYLVSMSVGAAVILAAVRRQLKVDGGRVERC